MNGNKGFSLVELLVVISIMGILMAISVPGLLEWRRNAVYKEAAQLAASTLRRAKGQAINVNQQVTVEFDLDNTLCQGDPLVCKDSVKIEVSGSTQFEKQFERVELRRGMPNCDVESGDVSITFNPNGTSNQSYICISDGATKKYRVGVANSTTGRVLLQKWQGGAWK